MSWRPNAGVSCARARAAMLARVRRFFAARDVLEVETPAIVRTPTTDPHIDSLAVAGTGGNAWLHTSPEHAMKRLLAAGYPDIFQVCKVFRDGETGSFHRREFTMVEWYRKGAGLREIIDETLELVAAMLDDPTLASADVVDYREVFDSLAGLDPLQDGCDAIADCLDADEALRASLGNDRDAWLDLAMATRVSPALPRDRLTAICHYPAGQASLARLCPADPAVADRFELFAGPLELANGFVELTDAEEQARRFAADRERRAAAKRPVPAADALLIDALRHGLPACAGTALGLDRVLMIDQGLDDIGATLSFDPGT